MPAAPGVLAPLKHGFDVPPWEFFNGTPVVSRKVTSQVSSSKFFETTFLHLHSFTKNPIPSKIVHDKLIRAGLRFRQHISRRVQQRTEFRVGEKPHSADTDDDVTGRFVYQEHHSNKPIRTVFLELVTAFFHVSCSYILIYSHIHIKMTKQFRTSLYSKNNARYVKIATQILWTQC